VGKPRSILSLQNAMPSPAHNRIVADGACLATWFLCAAASLKAGNSRAVSCTAGRIPMCPHTGPGFMTLNSDGLSARYKSADRRHEREESGVLRVVRRPERDIAKEGPGNARIRALLRALHFRIFIPL
jgi:hypothetical protein